ncbi:4-alpha-glucanotransferase [Sphingomonas sp. IW22]
MHDAATEALAQAAGILIDWEDADGVARRVSPESLRAVLSGLGLPCASVSQCRESLAQAQMAAAETCRVVDAGAAVEGLSGHARLHLEDGGARDLDLDAAPVVDVTGYHTLEHDGGTLDLIVTPASGVTPAAERRYWGLAVQLYSLAGAGGFGDMAALADFAAQAANAGADALMLSPVHALFTADPSRYSPYSPSSRRFLNGWYAPTRTPLAADGRALIDWPEAVAAKMAALRQDFAAMGGSDDFAAYVAGADDGLRQHAMFEALYAHFHAQGGARGWQDWPEAYRRPDSPQVAEFARDHGEEVRFHLFLQWRAEAGLAQAANAAADMAIGLVGDIAVGIDKGGSHAWSRGDELMLGIGIGAPPDAFQAAGQNWGITSFSPLALRARSYRPFIDLLRSAMAHAGGIRIDHALGLRRLWVVPDGASPLEGAYLAQPEDDLLRLIALESRRHDAIVIGEDLGVVPPGLRDRLTERGILGMRVLPFERDRSGAFIPPGRWDAAAVAMTSTHDLPPIAGWWRGTDIDWRERLGAAGDRAAEREAREVDRASMWAATGSVDPQPTADDSAAAANAAIDMVAETPAALAIIPVEDLLALEEAPNLPGTVDEHPNWRRRLPDPADAIFARPDVGARIKRLNDERPR